MQRSGLEFYTSQELINELVRRTTFLGVVVHSECRGDDWGPERMFKVHFSPQLNSGEAGRLLGVVAERLDQHAQ